MGANLQNLIEDLAITAPDGTPTIILVEDYRERVDLAQAIQDEAALFGVEIVSFARLDHAQEGLPQLDAQRNQAALLLVDPHEASAFGPWLDAIREALPSFVRFLVVVVLRGDLAALAKSAPAFMSWAKAAEIPQISSEVATIGPDEIAAELRCMTELTGLTPDAYVEAWQQGKLPDTHQNTVWLNLAFAATRGAG